jgi:hypothetical protein
LAKEIRVGAVDFVFAAKSCPSKVSLLICSGLCVRTFHTANERPRPLYACT